MNITKLKLIGGLLAGLFLIGLTGCDNSTSDSRLQVVSTIGMISDVAQNIGGEHVNAIAIMGPGIDPHLYQASEGDVRKLSKADVILYNGLHLESKMGEIFEKLSGKVTVSAVAEGIPESSLMKPAEYEGYFDPHVWFDVLLWKQVAVAIMETFIEADPEHAAIYKENGAAYLKQLDLLNAWVRARVSEVPSSARVLVTAHDAFGYFGKAYGFEVMGLQGMSTEAKASTKDVQDLANTIVSRQIPAMFIESAVPERNIKAVQAAAKAKGFKVGIGGELFADAMGKAGTEEGTYIGMVRHNVTTIVNALTRQNEQH